MRAMIPKNTEVIPNTIHRMVRSKIIRYAQNTSPFSTAYRKNMDLAIPTDIFSILAERNRTTPISAANRI